MNYEWKDQKGSKLAIVQALRMYGGMSRIDLARLTRLSRATISTSIGELMENRLVHETESKSAARGRPATVVELVPYSAVVIGAEYSNRQWTIGAFDLLGQTVMERRAAVDTLDAEETIRIVARELQAFARLLPASPVPLVGIGVPGLVDPQFGAIRSAPEPGWRKVEVAKRIAELAGLEAVVVNRHRARGLAECRYGAGQAYRNLIYIGVGDGIAAGLYVNRTLLAGSLGGAGELGHTTVDPHGPDCPCGNNGCLQMLASAPAIELAYRKSLRSGRHALAPAEAAAQEQWTGGDIGAAADEGHDAAALEAVAGAADYLGIAMANLVHLFNPEAIVLGGTVPASCRAFVESAEKAMRRRAMLSLSSETAVRTAVLGELGGALGAACFALDIKASSLSFFKS